MFKKTVFAGVVLLVAGMILALSIAHAANSPQHEVTASFTKASPGEFISQNISMIGSTGILYVSNSTYQAFLVPIQSVGLVNGTNAESYAVRPNTSGDVTTSGFVYSLGQPGVLYSNLSGTYNLVVFNNTAPSLVFAIDQNAAHGIMTAFGPLTLLGETMWIAGTIVSVIGFILPWKKGASS